MNKQLTKEEDLLLDLFNKTSLSMQQMAELTNTSIYIIRRVSRSLGIVLTAGRRKLLPNVVQSIPDDVLLKIQKVCHKDLDQINEIVNRS